MRTAASQATPIDAKLSELQQLLWNEPDAVDCLIVAHDDPIMIHRLSNAVRSDSVAVLPLRQSDWDGCTAQVLNLAEEYEIRNVIFAGHSEGAEPPAVTEEVVSPGSGNRLLSRVHRIQQQLGAARRHFARFIGRVVDIRSGELRLYTGGAKLEALFYIAASELFLRYDPGSQSFVPLVDRS